MKQIDSQQSALHRLSAPVGVAALAACGCVVVWVADPTTPGGPIPVCPTKLLLGIDCPGCGSLRMLCCLMHGNFLAAARFNAVGLAALVLLAWAYVAWSYGRIAGRTVWSWQHHRWSAPATLVVVGTWFVIRDIPFEPFLALHV